VCQNGARAVSQVILQNPATKSLAAMVVWIPMLDADELPSAQEASARFCGLGVPQFWDGSKRLGAEVARSLGVADWTAWDIYLFYPPGVEWNDKGLPPPEAALVQAHGVVVGSKGALPPVGDQAALPEGMQGRADVVGEQRDIAMLLARVAEPFAQRYTAAAR
jgi:hypothetical protein